MLFEILPTAACLICCPINRHFYFLLVVNLNLVVLVVKYLGWELVNLADFVNFIHHFVYLPTVLLLLLSGGH